MRIFLFKNVSLFLHRPFIQTLDFSDKDLDTSISVWHLTVMNINLWRDILGSCSLNCFSPSSELGWYGELEKQTYVSEKFINVLKIQIFES